MEFLTISCDYHAIYVFYGLFLLIFKPTKSQCQIYLKLFSWHNSALIFCSASFFAHLPHYYSIFLKIKRQNLFKEMIHFQSYEMISGEFTCCALAQSSCQHFRVELPDTRPFSIFFWAWEMIKFVENSTKSQKNSEMT